VVALLRAPKRPVHRYAQLIEDAGSALAILDAERGLFARDGLDAIEQEIGLWSDRGFQLLTVLDSDYPANLRQVHDRPPLVFLEGRLDSADARSVAIIGSRAATPQGIGAARDLAEEFVDSGYTVISGLAAGIDTAAHRAALASGGRSIAVIGTGVARCYPPQNAALQEQIAREGAVISPFFPDAQPTRQSFRLRNAVMSGLAQATVVVEASHRSGARLQARLALAHGRPVFLNAPLLWQDWARDLAERPGAYTFRTREEITEQLELQTAVAT